VYQAGRFDEAIAESEKAIAFSGDRADASNLLAWILATCPDASRRDARRAVELARDAVALAPKRGEYSNTLGVALYRAGNWNGAIMALNQSVALQGPNSWDGFFLAMARWKSGDHTEARRSFDEAVRWMAKNKPNDDLRRFRAEAAELLEIRDQVPSEK